MSTHDSVTPSPPSQSPDSERPRTPPGEGERRAQRGYTRQYDAAGAAIYRGLETGDLRWVGLADRCAGIADDVVLGYDDHVVGHQFKTSRDPGTFRIRTLLTGANGLLHGLVLAWRELKRSCPGQDIQIRVVISDSPADNDDVGSGAGTTRQFVTEWQSNSSRSIEEWRAVPWWPIVEFLWASSGLAEPEFEEFLRCLSLIHGDQADFITRYGITAQSRPQVDRIAQRLPTLVARVPEQDRWTREEFLREMGWRDAETLHRHQFPIGIAVQRNPATETELRHALTTNRSGYLSLVGPPGSGKSTLLQSALEAEPQLTIVRYLAFVPGAAQGIGRAEAADFHEDLIVELKRTGLSGMRFRRESSLERREEFAVLLAAAGQRFEQTGGRTLIVVDGLDHVPREERPERSFLSELPLPASVPPGVIFLLGTQRLDLPGIPPAVRDQADMATRRVNMMPLSQVAISSMADVMGLQASVPRSRLRELAHGHPLATHYLIQALISAEDEQARNSILDDGFEYAEDIDAYYASVLRELVDDNEVMDILGLVALAEAPLDLSLLEHLFTGAALERAWRATRHLLKRSQGGWSIFHNSFRLHIARVPRMRFGELDRESSTRLYQRLVEIAERAAPNTPQRLLRLRYLMRAGAHAEVLGSAIPAFFRLQYLAGRPASNIQDDIRLAFTSLRHRRDATAAFNLILASDEVSRRASAFEDGDETVKALIAMGQPDEAEALFDEAGGDGYLVVDAWLKRGDVDRARALFERVEPLHDLGSNSTMGGPVTLQRELERWVTYAVEFRSHAEIVAGIDRIMDMLRREQNQFHEPDELEKVLHWRAAFATIAMNPAADVQALMTAYRLAASVEASLKLYAAEHILSNGVSDQRASAIILIDEVAADVPGLANVPRGLRRGVALMAARGGDVDAARSLATGMEAPAVAELDDSTDYGLCPQLSKAVLEHAELLTLLDQPLPEVTRPRRQELVALQRFAEQVGVLAARSRHGTDQVGVAEINQVCSAFMRYVCRMVPGQGAEYFVVGQLDRAAPEVLSSLLQIAARVGPGEFAQAVEAVDHVLADHPSVRHRTFTLELIMAKAVANLGQDADDAERRLDGLLDRRDQATPSQFLESTAILATAFAQVGRTIRGQALLAEQRAHTLGYALRAKKDPQYLFWMSLLRMANRMDPGRRSERVLILTRQTIGMASTEGNDAAGRIAHGLILEAALDSAQLGASVARALLDADLIEMSDIVDALMTGTVMRDARLLVPCVEIWAALCLPLHRAAYYRVSEEGNFIREAVHAAIPDAVDDIGRLLLDNIEIHAQTDVRPVLLDSLKAALMLRRGDLAAVDAATVRVAGDPPLARSGGNSPMRYDDALNMQALAVRLEADAAADGLGYEATSAFQRLVPASEFSFALEVFQRHPVLQEENRCRFALVDHALAAGQSEAAARLTNEYQRESDRSFSWSWMMGGGRLRYYRARLQLEGESVHELAYANLAASLAAGEDASNSLLWEVDEIWPVLDGAPDWAGMWASVQDQLQHTRDYALGQDIDLQGELSDSALVAKLVHRAIELPVAELEWQAGRAALSLSVSNPVAFAILIHSLLSDSGDSMIKGLRLLRSAEGPALREEFASRIAELQVDDDFGVRILARKLAEHWQQNVSIDRGALPAFYNLVLPPVDTAARNWAPRERSADQMLVLDEAAWCEPFTDLIEQIAAIGGVSEDHICHRVGQLIESWGGVQMFGPQGAAELRGTLQQLGVQFEYFPPNISGALRALRHVTGELHRAGRIEAGDIDSLLRTFEISPKWIRTAMDRRPQFVARPTLPQGFNTDNDAWLADVDEDLASPEVGETILAELSQFRGRSGFTNFETSRLRLLGVELPAGRNPVLLFERLNGSALPVRSVIERGFAPLPRFELTLEPRFASQLGWRLGADGTSRWVNANDQFVATAYCWRDGGPDGQTHGNCLYGEGAAITLTELGRAQFEALAAPRRIETVARRAQLRNARRQERFAASSTSNTSASE